MRLILLKLFASPRNNAQCQRTIRKNASDLFPKSSSFGPKPCHPGGGV